MSDDLREGDLASYDMLSTRIARAITKSVGPMAVLFIASCVQALRLGLYKHYLVLGLGALLSGAGVFAYATLVSINLKDPVGRGWVPTFVTFFALFPYAFGCYLFFYEGLWRLAGLRHGFSLRHLLIGALFSVGGYWLVWATHQLSETQKCEKVTPPSAAV